MAISLLWWALVALAATALIWRGSYLLESASERLSVYYGLPEIVQGAVVVAVGSSFPELATVVVSATLHGEFELGVAAILGSAMFNILVIPGLAALVVRKQLTANRDLVYKEAQFYLISVVVLLLTFAFAALYVPVAGDDGAIRGELTRGLALIPLALYGLYIVVQYQDSMDYQPEVDPSDVRPGKQWAILLGSLGLILVGVEGLVRAAIQFGEILETPSFFWGVTVVAAATSVPDTFVSVQAARQGRAVTSLANVMGSNVFDLLVCIPIGVLIAGAAIINFSVAAPILGALTLATITLFLMMRSHLLVTRGEAWVLLGIYAGFVVWMAGESFAFVDWLAGLPPETDRPL